MRGRGPLDWMLAGVLVVVSLALGACAPGGASPTAPPTAAPTADPSPTVVPTSAGTPAASATAGGAVAVDGTLLDLLPASIDGAGRTDDAETGAEIAAELDADGGLAADLEAVAVALYAAAEDYAVVTVTRLRPGRFDAAYFRDWRDTFDAAVCDQAGGVDGRAEAPIAGRTAYIGTCVGGVRTYHVHLASPDRLVSLQALGPGRYGERILAGLTE